MIPAQLFARTGRTVRDLECRPCFGNRLLVQGLLDAWHSTHEPPPGYIVAFLLLDGETIVGVSTWGRPVARAEQDKGLLEHTRMALAPGALHNTGSRFLRLNRDWIRRERPEYPQAIAYVDATIHRGHIYRVDNWTVVYEDQPVTHTWTNRPGRLGNECARRTKFERAI